MKTTWHLNSFDLSFLNVPMFPSKCAFINSKVLLSVPSVHYSQQLISQFCHIPLPFDFYSSFSFSVAALEYFLFPVVGWPPSREAHFLILDLPSPQSAHRTAPANQKAVGLFTGSGQQPFCVQLLKKEILRKTSWKE